MPVSAKKPAFIVYATSSTNVPEFTLSSCIIPPQYAVRLSHSVFTLQTRRLYEPAVLIKILAPCLKGFSST